MIRNVLLAVAMTLGPVSVLGAQPYSRFSFPQQYPMPLPPGSSPVDGQWFFRGNPFQPAYVQTVEGPGGRHLIFTNEQGSSAIGWMNRDGRSVTIPEWNLVGTLRGNALVWPNGDFWSR